MQTQTTATSQPLDVSTSIRLPRDLLAEVDKLSAVRDSSRSAVVREALRGLFAELRRRDAERRELGQLLTPEVRDVLEDLPGDDSAGTLARCVVNEHRRQYPQRSEIRLAALDVVTRRDLTADDLIDEVLLTPHIDYLTAGVCLGAVGETVADWIEAHEIGTGPRDVLGQARFMLDRSAVYADGRRVGRIAFSRAPSTRYGRNLLYSFSGEAFRADGANLRPAQCMSWMIELTRHALEETGNDLNELRFVTLNRVDYVSQVKLKPGVTASDLRALPLPAGYAWAETSASHTGTTHYASQSSNARANCGQQVLIRVYDQTTADHCPEGEARIEIQIPRVRHVSGQEHSFGVQGAARIAAEVFAYLLPSDAPTEVIEPPPGTVFDDRNLYAEHLDTPGVHVLDTRGLPLAEEVHRTPYAGHNPRTARRLARQSLTIARRCVAAYITAGTISNGALDVQDQRDAPEHLGCTLHADGVPECVVEQGLLADPRSSIRELVADPPFKLEELHELRLLFDHFADIYYPGSEAPTIDRIGERNVWLNRMLGRVEHDPLETEARVLAFKDEVQVWSRDGSRLLHREQMEWIEEEPPRFVDWIEPSSILK